MKLNREKCMESKNKPKIKIRVNLRNVGEKEIELENTQLIEDILKGKKLSFSMGCVVKKDKNQEN